MLDKAHGFRPSGTKLLSGVEIVRDDEHADHERRLRALELHANGDVELSGNARQLHAYRNGSGDQE